MPITIDNIAEKAIFGAAHFLVLFSFIAGIGFLASGPTSIVWGTGLFISIILTLVCCVVLHLTNAIVFTSSSRGGQCNCNSPSCGSSPSIASVV